MTGRDIPNFEPAPEFVPDWMFEEEAMGEPNADPVGADLPQLGPDRWGQGDHHGRTDDQHQDDQDQFDPIDRSRLVGGGSFIFDQPEGVPAVWGDGDDVLWSEGEALWIVGPPGVGKTTVVGQLVRGRLGLDNAAVAWPVKPGAEKILYLAMDRPAQIARALRRHFTEDERQVLDERLVIWRGPPPADVAKHPEILVELCRQAGADTLIIDSVKDAALKLSDDETGSAVNRAIQAVTVEGIEVAALHHQRKSQGGVQPRSLEDVYGSTWLTAGAGSVILLWGQAGDLEVELRHLKQPVNDVGPLKLAHDHHAGTTVVSHGFDPLAYLRHRKAGATAMDAARQMYEKQDPTANERKKAQRRLDKLVVDGLAHRTEGEQGGADGSTAAVYKALTLTVIEGG